jgi:hypothetical protein
MAVFINLLQGLMEDLLRCGIIHGSSRTRKDRSSSNHESHASGSI